ncbi:MAG: hypothetical protein E6I03_11990 [Chloroflexi bacterium]|nr:MAG: hypothetical protein E6I03_11990 [Chloroflexota bacterium]
MDALADLNLGGQIDSGCDGVLGPTPRDVTLVQALYGLAPPGRPTTVFSAGPDIAVRFRDDNAAEEGYGVIIERWSGSGWIFTDSRFLTNSIAPCSAVPCSQDRTVYYRKPEGFLDGSYRLCFYQTSKLYPNIATVCAASRFLRSNLAFDTDGDGFSDRIESGTPLCQNETNDDPTDDSVINDGCPAYGGLREVGLECVDSSNTKNDDGLADDPFVNDGCPVFGAYSEASFVIGTDPRAVCSASQNHDAWPADINNDQFSDISDVVRITGSFGLAIPQAPNRSNIAPEALDRFVDITDLSKMVSFFGLRCTYLPAVSPFVLASGTYVGDGSSSRYIDVGFQPDMVIVKSSGNEQAVFRTNNMPSGESFLFICTPKLLTGIQSLESGGFTVGSDDKVNRGGPGAPTYHWFAIKDSQPGANIKFGSYTGNGQQSHPVTGIGFTPAWAFVKSAGGGAICGVQRQADMPASFGFAGGDGEPYYDGVLSLDGDGFTVGSRGDVNNLNSTIYYVAFKGSPNFLTGHYTGTGMDGLTVPTGPSPAFVSVKGDSNLGGSRARWRASGLGFPDANSASYAVNTPDSPAAIRALQAGGFEVGTDDDVNAAGTTYYWVALDAQVP